MKLSASLIILLFLAGCEAIPQQAAVLPKPIPEEVPRYSVTAGHEMVFFARQSSVLSPNEHRKLMALATTMRMDKTLRARLIGSTEHGTRNPSLALRRAIAVRNILSQMGVPPSRLSVKDEMRSDHILSQQRPEGGDDAAGRRVDIVIEVVRGQAI